MYNNSVPALLSENVGNTLTNYKTWGGVIFNAKDYKAAGDGTTTDTGAIANAIAAAAAAGGNVYFPPGTYVTGNQTVPTNVTLQFANGAKLSINSGSTVTVNGPIEAGLQQIFSGIGTVTGFAGCEHVIPQWWGAVGYLSADDTAAFRKAITAATFVGGTVFVPAVPLGYKITDTLDIPSSVRIVGSNVTFNGASVLAFYMDGKPLTSPAIKIHGTNNVHIEHIYVLNSGIELRDGLAIDGSAGQNSFVSIKNVISSGWRYAFYVNNTWVVSFRDCHGKSSTYGWYAFGGTITTLLIDHCYSESNTQDGYYVNGAYYTTFINAATDFCNFGYNFSLAKGVTMVGCGCEGAYASGINIVSSTVTVDGFASVGNGRDLDGNTASMLNAVNSKIYCRGFHEHSLEPSGGKTASISINSGTIGEYVSGLELLPISFPKNGRFLFNGQAFTTGLPTATGWLATDIGKVVHVSNPVEAGTSPNKYQIFGYQRLTAGNGNVLNTDWRELRALTGN